MPLPTCVKYIVFIMRVFAYIQHTKTRHSIFLHLFFISFNFKIASLLNEDQDLKFFEDFAILGRLQVERTLHLKCLKAMAALVTVVCNTD